MPNAQTSYERLKAVLAQELTASLAAAPSEHVRESLRVEPDELLIQAIWREQWLLADHLRTRSGKFVEVVDPGRWNRAAGPDFRDAALVIDGRLLHGDVEIHVRASDWQRHRHGRDFEYNGVIVHAFLECDDDATYDVLPNGARIERLALGPALAADLETLRRSVASQELLLGDSCAPGRCQPALAKLDVTFLGPLFDAAARRRMEAKIERILAWSATESMDQVLYQMLLAALGHKANRTLFFLLARRVPIEELKDILLTMRAEDIAAATEAVWLHVAGLLQPTTPGSACEGPPLDPPTRDYLDELGRWWSQLSGYYHDRVMVPTRRWYSGIRPASFPERRLAGLARVLAELDFLRGLAAAFSRLARQSMARGVPRSQRQWRREIALLARTFCPTRPSYWQHRFTLGGRRALRPTHLIGLDRGHHLLFNAVLPALLALARLRHDSPLETYLWQVHDHFPALESNSVSRFMRQRLLSHLPADALDMDYEKTQQALLHLFYDCCRGNARDCSSCALMAGPSGAPSSTPAAPGDSQTHPAVSLESDELRDLSR